MHAPIFQADTPAAFVGALERLGLDTTLDARLLDWFEASQLSPLTLRLVQRLALTQGCGTPRALLGQPRVWDALGRAVARTVLDDLRDWVTEIAARDGLIAAPPSASAPAGVNAAPPIAGALGLRAAAAPAEPEPPRLRPGMARADLRAWADLRQVPGELDRPAQLLDDRVVGRARHWFWRAPGATLASVVTEAPNGRAPDAVPEEVQEAAIAYLGERALRVARALLDEQGLLDSLTPPAAPAARALWDRAMAVRAVYRSEILPIPHDEAARIRPEIQDDPPLWRAADSWQRACPHYAGTVATLHLQAEPGAPLVTSTCGHTCPLGLALLDGLLSALGTPGDPRAASLLTALSTPSWARTLAALDAVLAVDADDDALPGWRVDTRQGQVIPVLCRSKKRGEGYKVARAAPDALVANPTFWGGPLDRDVRDLVIASPSGVGFATVVARLAGHPRVFVGSTLVPVEVVAVGADWAPTEAGGVRVTLRLGEVQTDATALLELFQETIGWVLLPDDDALRVLRVDGPLYRLVRALAARGTEFPPEAAEAVLARLAPLARIVPARVAPALRGVVRAPDTRPVLRLDPRGDGGLVVSALVRPLPGGPAFTPGEGPEELHAGEGEARAHTSRVRATEPAAVRAALRDLPFGAAVEHPAFTWDFSDVEDALDFVAAIQAGELAVEWAGPARRARTVTAKNLSLRVTSARDWLDVQGALDVDGATVELGALLTAVLAGKRYVAVDDTTWVQLGAELGAQLAAVAEVAEGAGSGTEVPKLAAPVLEELQAAGAAVDAPAGWDDLVVRARAAEGWEPELPAEFTATLRDYQRAGFAWMARLSRWAPGCCLADDMGLGKTVQTLALLVHRASLGPALVVAPTSVGFNWVREAARFAPGLRVRALRGADRRALLQDLGPADVLVTSWDLLPRDIDALTDTRFATLVLDEAQAMKNATTARAKAAARVAADFRVALSGTPVENRVSELWSLFRVVTPGLLGSWDRFRTRFAVAIERDGDTRRRAALARLIRPFLLRRVKSEVARELPARSDVTVEIALSPDERRLYDAARATFVAQLADDAGPPEQRRFKVLAALTRLRQLACHPRLLDPDTQVGSSKLARLLEILAELRAEGHRALVFSQFTRQLALVREALDRDGVRYRYLDGETPEARRRDEVDAFQRGEGEVFLLSLKAGGTGLTLTAATYVLHLDPWWNPAVEDQASDRAHRIGQTQPVTVYRLVAKGTIEQKILALHDEKRALVQGLLEGTGEAGPLGTDELVALLSAQDEGAVDEELQG